MPMLTMSVIALPVWPRMFAVAHRVGEVAHQPQHTPHIRHHVLAVHQHRPFGAVAQCGMQRGAVLGGIDLVAAEHAFDVAGSPACSASATSSLMVSALMRFLE